jgi:hypothetical protein
MKRLLLTICGLTLLMAPAIASAASQGFNVLDNNAKPGMLMSLTLNTDIIEPANDKNATRLVGVYVPAQGTSLNQKADQVQVATDGTVQTLVSTENGPILVGDKVGTSSLFGLGAKSLGKGYVVGTAQTSLSSTTKGAITTDVTDVTGHRHKVWIASIPVVVKVQPAMAAKSMATPTSAVPRIVQATADSVAGKHVTLIALLFSFVLLMIGIIFAGLITTTAVRSGFLAISRQPLAKRIINLQILRALLTAFAVLCAGIGSAYLLLKIL